MGKKRGTPREPRWGGARAWRRVIVLALAAAVVLALAVRAGYSLGYKASEGRVAGLYGNCSVLYIDQLAEDYPNPDLASFIVEEFEGLGCMVTVMPGESFTLDRLPLLKYYDVIIFRGHTGWANYLDPRTGEVKVLVGLFTGEKYGEDKYPDLQRRGMVVEGIPLLRPVEGYNKSYVALTQYYLEKYLQLKKGAVVILSTCFAGTRILAGIFMEKGASVVVGWDKNVTVNHADTALRRLVEAYSSLGDWLEAAKSLPQDVKVEGLTGARMIVYIRQGG